VNDDTLALNSVPAPSHLTRAYVWSVALFVVVSVAGLYYVKWHPYFYKALAAAHTHSIGVSIVTGKASVPPPVGWQAARSYTIGYFGAVWQAVILGLLVGSAVQALVPRDWLARVLGRAGFASTAIAGLVAVPGMMCTCCAAPAAVGLARSRVSTGATLAFWLGNPILNPATMIFMGFVLGWNWVLLRIAVGIVIVFGVAYWAGRLGAAAQAPARSVVAGGTGDVPVDRPSLARWGTALWQLSIGLVPEYIVIVMLLGAVRAWLFPAVTPGVAHSLWLVVGLAIAGTLFAIPTAGEIPIVQGLMALGLGPGGAGVLLTTLPAVSLPSLVMLGRVVPAKALVAVAIAVMALGLLSGVVAHIFAF
jgi:uncharacterized membrane protein YraQ (UPF0718 family)